MKDPKKELREYLRKLIQRLLYIKGINKQLQLLKEWVTPNRVEALEIGSYFFRLMSFSFNRTLLIELCLLLDDREEKCIVDWLKKAKEHAKVIEPTFYKSESGIREILTAVDYQKIIDEQQKLLHSKKDIIENIRGRRDTSLAHSDAKYFDNPEDTYIKFPLTNEDIEDLLKIVTEILRMQYVYLFESDLDIQVHALSNIDTVLEHIRAFNRLWRDKRAKFLYPYLYKLDNFEEKLREHLAKKK